jgi:two-component system, cell cycle sensor histidine kinase and response regulator CckA
VSLNEAVKETVELKAKFDDLLLELNQTNRELMESILEMDDRVAVRTRELVEANEALRAQYEAREASDRVVREQARLLDRANEVIITADLESRITFWNKGAERQLGWTSVEISGSNLSRVFVSDVINATSGNDADFSVLRDWRKELRVVSKTGDAFVYETRASVLRADDEVVSGWLIIAADITAQRGLEDQLRRSQRVESIGMLAAGIAHDLNNALAPIGMVAELLRRKLPAASDAWMLDTLDKSVVRGAGLVKQIVSFVRGADGESRVLQLKHLMHEVATVVGQTFPKSISVRESAAADLWLIQGQVTQVHQVLLNLCVNARDAMLDGGTLELRAENQILDDSGAAALPDAKPGRWVVLKIKDSGSGIPAAVLKLIWEPFFTTKAASGGTGLGLATVRGIVAKHGGFITLESEVGRGTVFRVFWPAVDTPEETLKALPKSPVRGRNELILIVEDEKENREVLQNVLMGAGYRVVTAKDGSEAISLIERRGRELAMVITDLDMPVLSGRGLISRIRALDLGIKIMLMSGSVSSTDLDCDAMLAKPFGVDVLLLQVGALLDKRSGMV